MAWPGLLTAEPASPAVRVTLQDTRTQLEDIQAAKDQLVARIQEVQAMLAMHTGMWSLSFILTGRGPWPEVALQLAGNVAL